MLARPLVYLKVSPGSLSAHLIGGAASATIACTALAHPRTLMGEFIGVQSCMKEALAKLGVGAWYRRPPITLVHLLPKVEGGYTDVELRAFKEAALSAGSSQAHLLADHPPLSVMDLSQFREALRKSVL
jgi:hypothetical protein